MFCGQGSQRCLDGKDKAVFDRRGCNDRGVLVQGWESLCSWFGRGVEDRRGCRRGKRKKFGALGCRKPEFVRPQKQALCYPKFLAIY